MIEVLKYGLYTPTVDRLFFRDVTPRVVVGGYRYLRLKSYVHLQDRAVKSGDTMISKGKRSK